MAGKTAQAVVEERVFQEIEIDRVHESAQNPRKHFDEAGMAQLVESVRTVGIITPILVRPVDDGYEIAAGHRRYRAARTIGLDLVPCHVRSMTDQEFIEVLTIENLQREDVHPLDEAEGYRAMLAAPYRMPVERIAERVGRSVKYVYDRVKLLDLSEELQELFLAGRLTAGHAILLARLTPEKQRQVLGDRTNAYLDGGLFESEHALFDPDAEEEPADGIPDAIKVRSVRELEAWIDTHVRFDRTDVDPMLFPETVAKLEEVDEPHGDVVPITYEHSSPPDVKASERTLTYRSWRRADGLHGSKTCDQSVLGCVVFGVHRGEVFQICINKKTCTVHWGDEVKLAKAREQAAAAGPGARKVQNKAADLEAKRKAAEDAERVLEERWQRAVPGVLQTVAAHLQKQPIKQLLAGPIGRELIQDCLQWGCSPEEQDLVPQGKTADEFVRHLAWIRVIADLKFRGRAEESLEVMGLKQSELLERFAPVQTAAPHQKKQEISKEPGKKRGRPMGSKNKVKAKATKKAPRA